MRALATDNPAVLKNSAAGEPASPDTIFILVSSQLSNSHPPRASSFRERQCFQSSFVRAVARRDVPVGGVLGRNFFDYVTVSSAVYQSEITFHVLPFHCWMRAVLAPS